MRSRRHLSHFRFPGNARTFLRRFLFGFLAVCAALALLAAALNRPLAGRLKDEIESRVAGACEPCELRVEELSLGLSPPRVELRGISFHQGDPRDSAVSFDADSVTVPVPLRNLTGSPWLLGLVKVEGLKVLLHEGDFTPPKRQREKTGEGSPLELECDGVAVNGGAFSYRKDSPAGAAWIRLTGIDAIVAPFGTYSYWRQKPVEADATALLERSGRVHLKAGALLHEPGPHVDVDLRVEGLQLHEVNPYFGPEEGVSLRGALLRSRAEVKVRDATAEGTTMITYEGLGLDFKPNRHRGGLSAVLNNLAVAVKVDTGNSNEARRGREKSVVARRHPRESVVSFVLRTMKEGALRVATD